jgi:hypothetical protein
LRRHPRCLGGLQPILRAPRVIEGAQFPPQ